MSNSNIVKLEDFFDFDSKKKVNRLAYSKKDMDYKIKIIKKMQELGMEITMDKAGNICGSISIGNNPQKTIAIGSHTDSVYDGGQFDGPVGVIVGLQTVEELLKEKKLNGTIKVAIYACEESSRFGNSCIGSKYLNDSITKSFFEKILDQKSLENNEQITLQDAINYATKYMKQRISDIKFVDKIFDNVDYALEAHIEQYKILDKLSNSKETTIGIISSIGSAVRIKYDVKGKSDHTGSTPMRKRKNAVYAASSIANKVEKLGKKYEKLGLGRASQVELSTLGHNRSFNQIPEQAEGLIDFRLLGNNTPVKVSEDLNNIIKKVSKKTGTKIIPEIVSAGSPVITSSYLNSTIRTTCNMNGINALDMPSYPGQDTAFVPAKEKTMIFIPSTGGGHNPKESTKPKYIGDATKIFTCVCKELLIEKFQDKYHVSLEQEEPESDIQTPSQIDLNETSYSQGDFYK